MEQMCELMRLRSLMRSICSELVSMLCSVLPAQPSERWVVGVGALEVAESALFLREQLLGARARSPLQEDAHAEAQVVGQARVQVAGSRAMPASEKFTPACRIFLSSMSVSTRSMMSPTCSMLMVKRDDVGPTTALASSSSASRDTCVR
jgi:hypothetical protein